MTIKRYILSAFLVLYGTAHAKPGFSIMQRLRVKESLEELCSHLKKNNFIELESSLHKATKTKLFASPYLYEDDVNHLNRRLFNSLLPLKFLLKHQKLISRHATFDRSQKLIPNPTSPYKSIRSPMLYEQFQNKLSNEITIFKKLYPLVSVLRAYCLLPFDFLQEFYYIQAKFEKIPQPLPDVCERRLLTRLLDRERLTQSL